MDDSKYSVVFILHKNARVKHPDIGNDIVLFKFLTNFTITGLAVLSPISYRSHGRHLRGHTRGSSWTRNSYQRHSRRLTLDVIDIHWQLQVVIDHDQDLLVHLTLGVLGQANYTNGSFGPCCSWSSAAPLRDSTPLLDCWWWCPFRHSALSGGWFDPSAAGWLHTGIKQWLQSSLQCLDGGFIAKGVIERQLEFAHINICGVCAWRTKATSPGWHERVNL